MQVIVAFVCVQVHGEFIVTGNMADFAPHAVADPPSDVPEFTGGEPERIKVVRHLLLVPYGSSVGAGDDLFRHT